MKSIAAGQIETAVKERIRVVLASPDLIARTFREVQAQTGHQRAELAGQRERLEARLVELKKAIGRLARSGGNDGAVATELGKLNEEFGQVQSDLAKVGQAVDALGAGGPNEDDVRQALQKLTRCGTNSSRPRRSGSSSCWSRRSPSVGTTCSSACG